MCRWLYWCEHPVAWCNQVQPPLCSPASLVKFLLDHACSWSVAGACLLTACAELSRLVNGDYGRKRVGNGKCLNEKRLTWLDKFAIYCCRYIAWVVPVLEFTWNEVLAVLT
ncbi:unnamed protein product, partial [Vitis vinifera]